MSDERVRALSRAAMADHADPRLWLELVDVHVEAGSTDEARHAWRMAKRALARLRVRAFLGDAGARLALRAVPRRAEAPDRFYDWHWSTRVPARLGEQGLIEQADGLVILGDLRVWEAEGKPQQWSWSSIPIAPPFAPLAIAVAATAHALKTVRGEAATTHNHVRALLLLTRASMLLQAPGAGPWPKEEAGDIANEGSRLMADLERGRQRLNSDETPEVLVGWLLRDLESEDRLRSMAGEQFAAAMRVIHNVGGDDAVEALKRSTLESVAPYYGGGGSIG